MKVTLAEAEMLFRHLSVEGTGMPSLLTKEDKAMKQRFECKISLFMRSPFDHTHLEEYPFMAEQGETLVCTHCYEEPIGTNVTITCSKAYYGTVDCSGPLYQWVLFECDFCNGLFKEQTLFNHPKSRCKETIKTAD